METSRQRNAPQELNREEMPINQQPPESSRGDQPSSKRQRQALVDVTNQYTPPQRVGKRPSNKPSRYEGRLK
jgi:hypothetical protein